VDRPYVLTPPIVSKAAHVDFLGAHTELANVVLSRDVDAAVAALTAHLQQTLHIVYGDVGDDAPRSGRG
jgi:DNA-binding GntR family transcriptional regulator